MCRKLTLSKSPCRLELGGPCCSQPPFNHNLNPGCVLPIKTAGWVLLISEEFEQARVLVALLVSIMFLAFHFAVKPLKRCA
jgi:hypothetical protein